MSKALVMRNVTHLHEEGSPLSWCGLPIDDMLVEGESRKIKGVEHEEYGCKQCFMLLSEMWEQLVKDYDQLSYEIGQYSKEDYENLMKCLELVKNNPALVIQALLSRGEPLTDAEAKALAEAVDEMEKPAPPARKAPAKTTAKKAAPKTGGKA